MMRTIILVLEGPMATAGGLTGFCEASTGLAHQTARMG